MLIGGARIGTAQIGMVMWKKSNIGQPAKYNFLLRKPIGYKFKFSFSSYSPAGECEHREVEIVAKGQRRDWAISFGWRTRRAPKRNDNRSN